MSNRRANDDDGAYGSLAHNARWGDLWAALLTTFVLLGSVMLVAILFSGRTSSLSNEENPPAAHTKYLQGIQDPARPGWRTATRPWDLVRIHELGPDVEDKGRENAMEDRGRGEATIESSVAGIWQAQP